MDERKGLDRYRAGDPGTERYHADDLSFDCADAAIEASAGLITVKAAAVTLAFCSGLDTCPS